MSIRRNRIVKPFRGQLYDMVVKNFAYVPVLNAKGQQVKEKGSRKPKRIRRKEVTDSFEIYYNLCLADEYFKMLYEMSLKEGRVVESTLASDYSKSWRYLLRQYAQKAPRGMRELAIKLEPRLGIVDKNINDGLRAVLNGTDINKIMGQLKGTTSSNDFKKIIEFYSGYLKQTFSMLGFNVISEVKSNPKFNIRYVQFSVGDEISDLIANSSEMVASEIEKAQKLKKIRDAKLKSDLLEQGYHVETQPVFVNKGRNKGIAYITVAYDPRVNGIAKPRSKPKAPNFNQRETDLILNLEDLVTSDTIYPAGINPNDFFVEPKCSIVRDEDTGEPSLVYEPGEEERNQKIIQQIKESRQRAISFSTPRYKEGYGLNSDGTPERGYYPEGHAFAGKPIHRYVVPKSRLKKYVQATRVFDKLLRLRGICEDQANQSKEYFDYKQAIKPFIKGVYNSDFVDPLGNTYQRFNDMDQLALEVLKGRRKKSKEKLTRPEITEKIITVDNYPDWDGNKVVYTTRKVKIPCFKYPSGSTYHPVHYPKLLQEALNRIQLGRTGITENSLTPKYREIKGTGGISKTFQLVTLKDSEGKEREIIVSGRYAGYELDTILNMEGRFIEGGYYSSGSNGRVKKVETDRILFDGNGKPISLDKVQDGDQWVYKQRLIEPYVTVNTKTGLLTLGIPGENSNKIDRKIMKDLSNKVSSIVEQKDPNLPAYYRGRNPFYTFAPEDFEIIRDSLGSVAMSASASKYLDAYYAKLRAKQNATSVENTERFTPEALGGFVKQTPRGPFKFNNKQREAAAWLDASGMQGVIALDTGVGKTLTSLVAIKRAINEGMEKGGKESKRRFLYVSPKSLVGNLKKEVLDFMVKGGDEFKRQDGVVEKTPNWQRIVLNRIDEMSYEDFVEKVKKLDDVDEIVNGMENGEALTKNVQRLAREKKHQGKEATITYEVGYKNGREIWRNEIDFQIGNLIDPTIVRTASTQEDEVRTIQELVSYPALNETEKDEKEKELAKARRERNKLKKEAKIVSSEKVNEHFEKAYYACFFDEINEIFGKGNSSKNYAVSALAHPRKVFLTASAIDRDPVDLYRLATLAKGKVPTRKSEKAFAEKYGVVLAGRMVALKPDDDLRNQFYNWVKENAYFAPKTDISYDPEFGVDYQEVHLPKLLKLKSRTITTQMPLSVQKKYKAQAKEISGELKAMVAKYRDLRQNLSKLTDEHGDLFDRRKSKAYQDLTKATGKVRSDLNKLIKISAEGGYKAKVGSGVYKDNKDERCLYFCTNKSLAKSVAKKNSKIRKDKVHAVLWAKEIIFYQNGKVVAKVEEKDNMSVDAFDAKYIDTGIYTKLASEEEDTETEPTWAMDISKKYVKSNSTLATAVCSDNYARGFNFQTFTKVIHLDRGNGFDSELLKQRTARAYRGGQAEEVEEIFIDATFSEDSSNEGTVSDSARGKIDLKNALSLQRNELEEGKVYQEYIWVEDKWRTQAPPFTFHTGEDELLQNKLDKLFNTMGYVTPLVHGHFPEPVKRIVLLKSMDIKDRATIKNDFDMLSIDQIKSLVNEADQDFFQDIIFNGLKSDLTARLDARMSDTGVAIKTPAMMRYVLDPTTENLSLAEKELMDFDANPCSHITFDPNRYDDADVWLSNRVNDGYGLNSGTKQILDMIGGPAVLDYLLGSTDRLRADSSTIYMNENRFVTRAQVSIRSDHIYNDFVRLKPCAPRGFSSKFLFAEIITAKRMGKKYIKCDAAGGPGSSEFAGYAVWPKFGFTTQINLSNLLSSVSNRSGEYAYVQAVREIYGENPGPVDLQKLLVVTADITVVKVRAEDQRAYKQALQEWENTKASRLGDRPVQPEQQKWVVGDKVIVKGEDVRRYYPSIFGKTATIVSMIENSRIMVLIDDAEGLEERFSRPIDLSWDNSHIRLISPRPPLPSIQADIDAWDLRASQYEIDNPKPAKPKAKKTDLGRVNVGEKLWGLYGHRANMYLYLDDNSTSMKIANAYLKRKALEKNVEIQDYLNSPSDLFNIEDPWCWGNNIDTVEVKGQKVKWTDVVKQYPEAFRTAWYAHYNLRYKVKSLCERHGPSYDSFLKKYRLADPGTQHNTPSPEARALQSRTRRLETDDNSQYTQSNPQTKVKLGSADIEQAISDRRLWEESQDPCLQAVWDQLRLENYVGSIVAEIIEGEEDPELIEAQRARKAK